MKRIQFLEIPVHLLNNEGLEIYGGKIYIKKHLTAIIGGVPVYNFEICRPKEDKRPVIIDSIEELNNYTTLNSDGIIPRCIECDCLPVDTGYYFDEELQTCICSYECLIKYMNNLYGKGRWKVENNEKLNKSEFYVKKSTNNDDFIKYDLYYNRSEKEEEQISVFNSNLDNIFNIDDEGGDA